MKTHDSLVGPRQQRGAVLILFGLSLVLLIGFAALVIDLGRTYVVRTELQNAADAAALAGAKQLDQTGAKVCCDANSAAAYAIAVAAQNNFMFSSPVTITAANLSVGSCPDDSCMVAISSISSWTDTQAARKTFLKVDIPSGGLATFFARVPTTAGSSGTLTTNTYGRAVAGRFVNDLTPIAVCAIKDASGMSRPKGEALSGTNELAQFGFRRGVSYNIFALGPLGSPSDTYLINPVDVYPNSCDPNNSSANSTAPFICGGSSAVLSSTPGTVYGNAGISAGKIQAALNSRFNIYGGPSVCIPTDAPPDGNITKYGCTGGGCATPAANWMDPNQQTIALSGIVSKNNYGVLWSYSRAVQAVTDGSTVGPGAPFTLADWAALYPATGGSPVANASFPAVVSPYLAGSFTGGSVNVNRRVLNLAIANCPEVSGSGSCTVIPILGIGRFFMQVPADFNGSPKKLEVEFSGLIEPVPVAEIKLYR